jgi:UDP-glucose 4-epimerase
MISNSNKILIIGSEGFIGHNLLKHFEGEGYEVWGADILSESHGKKQFFKIDSLNPDFNYIFCSNNFSLSVNCSGIVNIPGSLKDPTRDYYLNTFNVFKILEAIRVYQPSCRFVNLSSAAVYGNPISLPIKEDFEVTPLSPYGFHKLQSELLCKEYKMVFGIQSCSLRIFSVYGPGQRKQIFWDIFQKIKLGLPFTLYGTGNESRDFIYISDLVQAIDIVAINADFETDVINIANGEEIYIGDAVSIFTGLFRDKISYSFSGETRKGDPLNWKADISRLTSLGYRKAIDIQTGLQSYFNWITSNNDS